MDNKPFVSVLIAMRNEMGYIQKCLESFHRQDYPKDRYEIIIIDGKSEDGCKEYVKTEQEKHHNLILLDNPHKISPVAWNIGLRYAKGEIIIIMGGHTSVPQNYLSKNVEYLQKTDAACVGGRVISLGNSFIQNATALAYMSPFGIGNAKYRYLEKEAYVETINFGAYWRSAIDKVGEFDERLLRNQDWDFNYRIRKSGGKFFFTPQIQIYYYSRASLKKLFKQQFWTAFWKIRVLQKYPQSLLIRHLIPPIFVFTLLFTAIGALFGNFSKNFFIGLITLYLFASTLFALKISFKNKKLGHFWILPLVFFTLHISYGLGFLWGCIYFNFINLRKNKNVN